MEWISAEDKMKKYIASFLLLVSFVAVLSGCSSEKVSGTVVGKNIIEAHTKNVVVPFCYSVGNCTYTNYVPATYYYSDAYEIQVKLNYGSEEIVSVFVSEEVYNELEIGSDFSEYENECIDNTPYAKEQAIQDSK